MGKSECICHNYVGSEHVRPNDDCPIHGGNRIVKVRRVLEYEGPWRWVNVVLKQSYIQPNKPMDLGDRSIKETERVVVQDVETS